MGVLEGSVPEAVRGDVLIRPWLMLACHSQAHRALPIHRRIGHAVRVEVEMQEHDRRRPGRELEGRGGLHVMERIEPWELDVLRKAIEKPEAPTETSESCDA